MATGIMSVRAIKSDLQRAFDLLSDAEFLAAAAGLIDVKEDIDKARAHVKDALHKLDRP